MASFATSDRLSDDVSLAEMNADSNLVANGTALPKPPVEGLEGVERKPRL
jgi:hypothetical protein